jgi:hypothetical protein
VSFGGNFASGICTVLIKRIQMKLSTTVHINSQACEKLSPMSDLTCLKFNRFFYLT